jgi:hypothetical protein
MSEARDSAEPEIGDVHHHATMEDGLGYLLVDGIPKI